MVIRFVIFVLTCAIISVHTLHHSMDSNDVRALRDKALEMFDHAYSSYMLNAFPADELMPLSCQGRYRGNRKNRGDIDDTLGNFTLTLVDTLDTLAVIGRLEEFETAIQLVIEHTQFDTDVVVSVFETNIRMLGGLLGGHVAAVDLKSRGKCCQTYTGGLLEKAHELGKRLLPAFNTQSGIPYPKVNLKYGLKGLSLRDTCTACAGTMILEFSALSRLTGDSRFEDAAHKAMDFLWMQRNVHSDLMGTVLNINNGDWVRKDASIGAGIDSYYEYLLKAYILLGEEHYLQRFNKHYSGIMRYLNQGHMMISVDMHKPTLGTKNIMDSLLAFWPGLQVLKGDLKSAIELHEVLYQIVQRHNFLPEAVTTDFHVHWGQHPLRPEFLESTYFLYKATGDPHYLEVGKSVLNNLEKLARVPCGFAAIKDVRQNTHEDQMDSYVLAETFKYLYLLFEDESNLALDVEQYVFTTEAHILPLSLANHSAANLKAPIPSFIPLFSDSHHDSSCPNVREIQQLSTIRYAQMLRSPLKDYVELKCPKPKALKTPRLRAQSFQPGNTEHMKLLKRMGIVLSQSVDNRLQLVHQQNMAESTGLAEEGLAFMKEMLELAETQQESIQVEPRLVQVIDPDSSSSEVVYYSAGAAQFGYKFSKTEVRPMKFYEGGVLSNVVQVIPPNACEEIENQAYISGKIVLVIRGSCTFIQKTRNLQQHGAVGVIVIDNVEGSSVESSPLFQMSGEGNDGDVTIPAVFLFHNEGQKIKQLIEENSNIELYIGTNTIKIDDDDSDYKKLPHVITLIDGGQTNVLIEAVRFYISVTYQSGQPPVRDNVLTDHVLVDDLISSGKPMFAITMARLLDFTEENDNLPDFKEGMDTMWNVITQYMADCGVTSIRSDMRTSLESYIFLSYRQSAHIEDEPLHSTNIELLIDEVKLCMKKIPTDQSKSSIEQTDQSDSYERKDEL